MTILIATSVVRGAQQGDSHGGVYLVDLQARQASLVIDWNKADIDWQGRGWDRGLRGICFHADKVYIAASDELFVFSNRLRPLASYRNPFLRHCHEIAAFGERIYLTSTGFDSILGFDPGAGRFCWGMHVSRLQSGFRGIPFDPQGAQGPSPVNQLHLNSVFCDATGMHVGGLRTQGLLCFDGRRIARTVTLPQGVHNAQPFGQGVLFNDTESDVLRFATPEEEKVFRVPRYDPASLQHTGFDDSRIARQGFARGLCVLDGARVAGGSSPSTIAIHDLEALKTVQQVTLSRDIRNAIHGLEVWPYAPPVFTSSETAPA